jgi:hypothetical protein
MWQDAELAFTSRGDDHIDIARIDQPLGSDDI